MHDDPPVPGLLTKADTEAIGKKVLGMISGSEAEIRIWSSLDGRTSFVRGDAYSSSEQRRIDIGLELAGDRRARATISRVDDESLRQLVVDAEKMAKQWRGQPSPSGFLGPQVYKKPPKLFFEQNLPLMTPDGRASLMGRALEEGEAGNVVSAGDVTLLAGSTSIMNTSSLFVYSALTFGSFSMTARTPDGTGSGWAWSGHEDWSRVDGTGAIAKAIDLGKRTAHPVAIEPGRYTVILEPTAVADLTDFMFGVATSYMDAQSADQGTNIYSKPGGGNKIGLQMIDSRLSVTSNPWDPDMPGRWYGYDGEPLEPTTWFDHGELKNLAYSRTYAAEKNRAPLPMAYGQVRLATNGPTQTLEEMIASTKRGVWVNRFSNVFGMNNKTMLLTGTTRDGTFLIEDGKITKAIKNFRFTESPLFILNKVDAIGEPVRASTQLMMPRLKVRDFDFTSLTDAV